MMLRFENFIQELAWQATPFHKDFAYKGSLRQGMLIHSLKIELVRARLTLSILSKEPRLKSFADNLRDRIDSALILSECARYQAQKINPLIEVLTSLVYDLEPKKRKVNCKKLHRLYMQLASFKESMEKADNWKGGDGMREK